jgi:hypothetical protein
MVSTRRQPQSTPLGTHGRATSEARANLTNKAKPTTRDTRFFVRMGVFQEGTEPRYMPKMGRRQPI